MLTTKVFVPGGGIDFKNQMEEEGDMDFDTVFVPGGGIDFKNIFICIRYIWIYMFSSPVGELILKTLTKRNSIDFSNVFSSPVGEFILKSLYYMYSESTNYEFSSPVGELILKTVSLHFSVA